MASLRTTYVSLITAIPFLSLRKRLVAESVSTSVKGMIIEPMEERHLRECHRLNFQLGYDTSYEEFAGRFELIRRREDHLLCIGLLSGEVGGWMHVQDMFMLERENGAQIASIVVDERVRGQGVGKALLAHGENWAKSRGHAEVFLSSNLTRAESHKFYERAGYLSTKQSKIYFKKI